MYGDTKTAKDRLKKKPKGALMKALMKKKGKCSECGKSDCSCK